MGSEHTTTAPVANPPAKGALRASDPSYNFQQAGNQATQQTLKDTPTFDDYDFRTQGNPPRTASADSSPLKMAGHGARPATFRSAANDFAARFPFLKDLPEKYRVRIAPILGQDQQDYRDLRRVDTPLNRYYLEPGVRAYTRPEGADRLDTLSQIESNDLNARRVESIPADAIFSMEAPIMPRSPLAESDAHTFLRLTWQKIQKQPVYLTIDGWSDPALKVFITDGTFSWEVRSSPRPIEMEDLLSISLIRRLYIEQETSGPKRTALKGAIEQARNGLNEAENSAEYQLSVNEGAAWGVVGVSEWRGKRAAFPNVVDAYRNQLSVAKLEQKAKAYQPSYLEQLGFLIAALSYAGETTANPDALTAQFLRESTPEGRRDFFWSMVQGAYKGEDTARRYDLHLTEAERDEIDKEANELAEKDWKHAPDVLPDNKLFARAKDLVEAASRYLDEGNLQAAFLYASLGLQLEQRLAASIDRYKTRVTTGAGSAVKILTCVETASKYFVMLFSGPAFAQIGIDAVLGSSAAMAVYTGLTSYASGEGAAKSIFSAEREFITGMLLGDLTELMAARFVERLGVSKGAASLLASVAASPYAVASNVVLTQIMDPNAPLPSFEEIENQMVDGAMQAFMVTIANHYIIAPVAKSFAPPAEPSGSTGSENKMSGTGAGSPPPAAPEPGAARETHALSNEEWTEQMRKQGPGAVPVPEGPYEAPLKFGIYKTNIRSATEAYNAFNEAVSRTPDREVGMFRNIDTGEYAVQVGSKGSVGPPSSWLGHYEMVLHYHTNEGNILVYRLPSGADVALAREVSAHLGGRPVAQFIEYPLPEGGRGRTTYTVSADGKVTVEFFHDATKTAQTESFSTPEEYQQYWDSRTRFVEPGSADYHDLMNEAERILKNRPVDPDVNKMSGRPPFGYDSGLGISKSNTAAEAARKQKIDEKVAELKKLNKFEQGKPQTPEAQEYLWELENLPGAEPDPLANLLARWRGTHRDQVFRDFIIPRIKELMPENTVFGVRDWAAFQQRLGLKRLPWAKAAGPDLFLIDPRSKPIRIKPLDLTSPSQEKMGTHQEQKQGQAHSLQRMLDPLEYLVEEAQDFTGGGGTVKEVKILRELADVLRSYGAKLPDDLTALHE